MPIVAGPVPADPTSRTRIPQPPHPDAALLTRAEVAGLLRVSVTTLTRLRGRTAFPPARRVAGSLRWSRADVEAWVSAQPEVRWDARGGATC